MASSATDREKPTAAAMAQDNYNVDGNDSDVEQQPQQRTLSPSQRKALQELRAKLEAAILRNDIMKPPEKPAHHQHRRRFPRINSKESSAVVMPDVIHETGSNAVTDDDDVEASKEISLWGVPLFPGKGDEGTDHVLLKFLSAKDFKPLEALEMIQKTLRWRREMDVDRIRGEDLGVPELEEMVYVGGEDKEGRPVTYESYGAFKDREVYEKMLQEERLLRWRVKLMERVIDRLGSGGRGGGGAGSFLHVVDLKDAPAGGVKGLHSTVKKVITVLMENYPEFMVKLIFVNVSFRFYVEKSLFSNLAQRTKSKFMFVRPSKVTEKLLKFIAPEELPVRYGGLKRDDDDDDEFSDGKSQVSEVTIKPGGTESIVIPAGEAGVTVVWDVTVVGWEASYKAEYVPDDECMYTVLVQEERKLEESVRSSFYISDPGEIVLTIENKSFRKRKKALYRWKTKPTLPSYATAFSIVS